MFLALTVYTITDLINLNVGFTKYRQTHVRWQLMINFSFQGFVLYNYYKMNKIKICDSWWNIASFIDYKVMLCCCFLSIATALF